LLGIILGAIGISRAKRGRQRGRVMAVIGLVLGCLWFMATVIELAVVL
jgi:hypothetical protein